MDVPVEKGNARIAEILFRGSNAAVEFVPVMNGDELKKALSRL